MDFPCGFSIQVIQFPGSFRDFPLKTMEISMPQFHFGCKPWSPLRSGPSARHRAGLGPGKAMDFTHDPKKPWRNPWCWCIHANIKEGKKNPWRSAAIEEGGRFSTFQKVSSHKPSEWKFLAAEPSFKSVKRQAGSHSNPFETRKCNLPICPASKCFKTEHPKDPLLNQCSPKKGVRRPVVSHALCR